MTHYAQNYAGVIGESLIVPHHAKEIMWAQEYKVLLLIYRAVGTSKFKIDKHLYSSSQDLWPVVVPSMHVKYSYRKLHTLVLLFHVITCIISSSAKGFLVIPWRFRQSSVGDFCGAHPGRDRVFFSETWCYDHCWHLHWFDILTVNHNYIYYCFQFCIH